jgi:hypothetical protein
MPRCPDRLILTLAFLCLTGPALAGAALLSEFAWPGDDPRHGGFSAIVLLPDREHFILAGDKGSFAKGRLVRTEGIITGIEDVSYGPLLSTKNEELQGDNADAEGMARSAEGRIFLSFEANDRIAVGSGIDVPPDHLLRHPDFVRLQDNSALEALALQDDGTLVALPERSGRLDRPFPAYRWKDGDWLETWTIPRSGEYLVTDAAFGPDGQFYLLERQLAPFSFGFSTRVRRFPVGDTGFGAGETLLETPFGLHANLEGLAVWRDDQGLIRLTMISDDNFSSLLATQFVEYALSAE